MSEGDRFFEAVYSGKADAVRGFLAADPKLAGARNYLGVSALMVAIYHKHPEVVEALRAAARPLDAFEATALGETARLAALLDAAPGLVRSWSPEGFTLLHMACYFGHAEAARLLLDRGMDPNAVARDETHVRPLHSAAAGRRADLAALLLERGADPRARQEGGWTALHSAAQNGDAELARLLLDRGADPTQAADDGRTPIELARRAGDEALLALLAPC